MGFWGGQEQTPLAVKIIERNTESKAVRREIEITRKITSKNVVRCHFDGKTASKVYLVMEYCNGGDLKDFLQKRGGYLSEEEAKPILRQLVEGLRALASQGVIHRDLKPANIMIHFPDLTKQEMEAPGFSLDTFIRDFRLLPGADGTPAG